MLPRIGLVIVTGMNSPQTYAPNLSPRCRYPSHVYAAMNVAWLQRAQCSSSARALLTWQQHNPEIFGIYDTVLAVTVDLRRQASTETCLVFLALLDEARNCPVAYETAVSVVLPIVAAETSRREYLAHHYDGADDFVASFMVVALGVLKGMIAEENRNTERTLWVFWSRPSSTVREDYCTRRVGTVRARFRVDHTPLDEVVDYLAAPSVTARTSPAAQALIETLAGAVASAAITETHRQVLINHVIEGRTHAQTAQRLGVSERTIRSRYSEAVTALTTTLTNRVGMNVAA